VYDAGFVLGATVAEQVRTFGGRLFRLDTHLARLTHSLEIVGVDPGLSMTDLYAAAEELACRNHALLDSGDDLGISIFVTPGPYATMASSMEPDARVGPTVCMHTYPLPFHVWAEKYRTGQAVVVTDVQQVPPACWPPELKCRSRMHYYLADSKARKAGPGSRALLLDRDGHVLEASTANICIYRRDEGLVSPPKEKILPGVTVGVTTELADEVMLCSTSPCVWPVVRLNGQTIAGGIPGEVFRQLLAAWSALVGLDIQAQAERFAKRG
jgi:branched-subunit amino acid aminotransferase/4-amino-4-deoxychorismate lyase